MQPTITLLYFAALQQQATCSSETWPLHAPTTLAQLYAAVQAKHQFALNQNQLRVALNHHFSVWDAGVVAGDVVAFIPPVSGG